MAESNPSFHGETSGPENQADGSSAAALPEIILVPMTQAEFAFVTATLALVHAQEEGDVYTVICTTLSLGTSALSQDHSLYNAFADKLNDLTQFLHPGTRFNDD